MGNLDKGEYSHLNFRVREEFHKEFAIFAIRHNFKSQIELLYKLFELGKNKYEAQLRCQTSEPFRPGLVQSAWAFRERPLLLLPAHPNLRC